MVTDTNTSYNMGSSLFAITHWRAQIFTNIAETPEEEREKARASIRLIHTRKIP